MDFPCSYAGRPVAFLARYIARRPFCHAAILVAVLGAVIASVSAQYGVKFLVDTLSGAHAADAAPADSRRMVGLDVERKSGGCSGASGLPRWADSIYRFRDAA